MWSLRKWYLDCVAPDGTTWIGYWGWLRLGPMRIAFASSTLNGSTSTTIRRCEEPREREGGIDWTATPLGIHARLTPRLPSVDLALHPAVRWRCVAPAADVTVSHGTDTVRGHGYAEVLEIDGAPWNLPIRELRWGRAIGERTSLVWIRWDGPAPLRILVRDGAVTPWKDDLSLTMTGHEILRSDVLGDTLQPIPLSRFLPRRLTAAREQKWRGRAAMQSSDGGADVGWVIHELVTFPPG